LQTQFLSPKTNIEIHKTQKAKKREGNKNKKEQNFRMPKTKKQDSKNKARETLNKSKGEKEKKKETLRTRPTHCSF